MTKKYTSYKEKELLDDEDFIQSIVNPTPETEKYWDTLVEYDLLSGKELEQARAFMETVKKPHKVITVKEKNALWIAIEVKTKKSCEAIYAVIIYIH
ncbi:MAG: hypothetical protein LIP01_13435 [Tannerellaceae bacterium]|nr:hypothetical protein [Tannerellaceae bacterium]